jgi:hypothetical protein
VGQYGRAGKATDNNIIQRMRLACWLPKATDSVRVCNTYFNDKANASQCYVIRTLPILLFFSHYLINDTIFEENVIEHKLRFFLFSLQLCLKHISL